MSPAAAAARRRLSASAFNCLSLWRSGAFHSGTRPARNEALHLHCVYFAFFSKLSLRERHKERLLHDLQLVRKLFPLPAAARRDVEDEEAVAQRRRRDERVRLHVPF